MCWDCKDFSVLQPVFFVLHSVTHAFRRGRGCVTDSGTKCGLNCFNVENGTFEQLKLLQDAENAMCESLEIKKTYQTYARELSRLVKYADRDDITEEAKAYKDAIIAIYNALMKKRKHSDKIWMN